MNERQSLQKNAIDVFYSKHTHFLRTIQGAIKFLRAATRNELFSAFCMLFNF